jgi:phosphoribosylformylglycinamidine (FGAM) synthase PurS component
MALANLYVQFKQDPEAENLSKQLRELGYHVDDVRIEHRLSHLEHRIPNTW